MRHYQRTNRFTIWLAIGTILLTPLLALTQTKIVYHKNKYQPSDDVRLGREAAREAEEKLPIMRDRQATDYLEGVGQRLVAAIPPEFQHPEFRYYFKVVNASDINAFALPGGPMYVNRGTIEAARNEGELAGVMAHELSHVALRHGTAQATKAEKYAVGAGIAGILGTIVAGPAGGQLAQAPVVGYYLHYSREYESEADLLGARIMARAGYDPHDLANMFKTIERVSGSGGGGWFSDHPSSKDRYAKINAEAETLRVENPITDNRDFRRIQARLSSSPRALSTEEISRRGERYPTDNSGDNYPSDNRPRNTNDRRPSDDSRTSDNRRTSDSPPTGRVGSPSTRTTNYTEFGFLRVSAPDNWRELSDNGSVWFAPEGGYGQVQGQTIYTHGINFTVSQAQAQQDLEAATDQAVNNLLRTNPKMRRAEAYKNFSVAGRDWISTKFTNRNEATARAESISFFVTRLRNGSFLFISTVAPDDDATQFQNAFGRIMASVQLKD